MLCNKHRQERKENSNTIWEEALVYKMSYHLDRPHEPISVHQRWPSQSWQGTLRGWGSLDWRWRTRSSLVLEPQCPLADPQQEPKEATMSSQRYCKHSSAGVLLWICDDCRYAVQSALIMMWHHYVCTHETKSTSLSSGCVYLCNSR